MAISLKHAFQSAKADGTDNTIVQPSDWNDEHVLTQASGKLLGRTSAGAGETEEITAGTGLTLGSGTLSADVTSVAGKTGAVSLSVSDISGAAPLASPALTGTPTAPTAVAGTNSTQIATTAYVQGEGYLTATTASATYLTQTAASTGYIAITGGATGAANVPYGTTAQRPAAATGLFRFNTTLNKFEGYNGSAWGSVGGGATGSGTDDIFIENGQAVTQDYTITASKNAGTFGPITINSGVTVTVPSGSTWTVV